MEWSGRAGDFIGIWEGAHSIAKVTSEKAARLFVAAPYLLGALKTVLDALEEDKGDYEGQWLKQDVVAKIEAAIALTKRGLRP